MKLTGKIFITGDIVAETGLHIGGSKSSLDIGGIDLNVIKTPQGVPFIPGSSLKGKLRSMLAKVNGSVAINKHEAEKGEKTDEEVNFICEIFGLPADEAEKGKVTRLIVRDAALDTTAFTASFEAFQDSMETEYSDVKWENSINRKTGTAQHPRQLERVPAGAVFNFEMVYDVYDDDKEAGHLQHIRTAMRLLEGDYLGGQGSRGYGKVRFANVAFTTKSVADYEGDNQPKAHTFQF